MLPNYSSTSCWFPLIVLVCKANISFACWPPLRGDCEWEKKKKRRHLRQNASSKPRALASSCDHIDTLQTALCPPKVIITTHLEIISSRPMSISYISWSSNNDRPCSPLCSQQAFYVQFHRHRLDVFSLSSKHFRRPDGSLTLKTSLST